MSNNPYLTRLRALNSEKGIPCQPSKPSKAPYEGFEGERGICFSKNQTFVVDADLTQNSQKHLPRQPSKPSKPDGFPLADALAELEARCPDYVDPVHWHRAIEDGRRFLATWGVQAEALTWTPAEVFGLHTPPSNPHPSYDRTARYDDKGLVWLLEGRTIVAMSSSTAAIQHRTGTITSYRKHNKPGLGPLGDSLDDFK